MTRAINAWCIYHRDAGLLLHAVAMNKFDAWAALRIASRHYSPDEPMRSDADYAALGFRAIPIRIKYDEPEEK